MKKTIYIILCLLYFNATHAQTVDIPDPGFKEFLISEGIDLNMDGQIQVSEAEAVQDLLIHGSHMGPEINSIEGIRSFSNLKNLNFDFINLQEADISGLEKLNFLSVSVASIGTIKAHNCIGLKQIHLLDHELLNAVDFTGCTALETVLGTVCASSIKFDNCTSLRKLSLSFCQFNELSLEGCINLNYFEVFDPHFDFTFDFTQVPALDTFIMLGFTVIEFDVINVPNLKYLELDHLESLTVSECPMLEEIIMSTSRTINITKLPKLRSLDILAPVSQTIRIEDCALLESFMLYGEVGELYVRNCPSIESLDFIGGTEPEIWDFTGLSGLKSITSVNGPLELILTGCYNLESFTTEHTGFSTYDFSECINLKELHLNFNYLENLIIRNGSMDTIFMNHAPFLKNICIDPEEFLYIQSILQPFQNQDINVTTSCAFSSNGKPFQLKGTSYYDVNNDSCKTSDVTLPFSKYTLTDGVFDGINFYTNEGGEYLYNVVEGDFTYGPELLLGDYIFTTIPEERSVSFPTDGVEVNQNFCFVPSTEEVDIIEVHLIPLDEARPGFDARYLITFTNTGNVMRGGDIKLTFQDQFMDFLESEPMVDIQEEGFLSWSFENMVPYETRSIEFTMNLNSPMETPPLNGGEFLKFKAEVDPMGNQTSSAYWSHLDQEVVNSFDPNDKTCLNGSAFDQELVGDYLNYMIRFENTGTADAVNIVITDTLDPTKLDVRTLEVILASHKVETELVGNVVTFSFKDIYLPFADETNDGFVTFKIKTLSTLQLGDDIRNKAEIFFDFNFPIITNTTSTIISDFTAVKELEADAYKLSITPNPASEFIQISSDLPMKAIELLDIHGRLVDRVVFTSFKNQHFQNIEQLPSGVYFIKSVLSSGDFSNATFVIK